jgi:aminopeptidase N
MKRKYIFCLLSVIQVLITPKLIYASDPRNDSVDVEHYSITLNVTDFKSGSISGHCDVKLKSKIGTGLKKVTLELYKLKIDSVQCDGFNIPYYYNDSILVPNISRLSQLTFTLSVYYHGKPSVDRSGFGGFAFSNRNGGVAYNLGIGFKNQPHNMGRMWFPCIDNFTDKAIFDFNIITQPQMKAFCNGLLKDSSLLPDGNRKWIWEMQKPICTYLAGIAVSRYATLYSEYTSIDGRKIPIQIGIYPKDSATGFRSFGYLKECLRFFEEKFGPYPYERVGYVAVPENVGAMEHPGNIAYPDFAVHNGDNYSFLWAHELSHAWFGDLVTCSSAQDMWLNEGWASYCEALFYEKFSGREMYLSKMQSDLYATLRSAPFIDSGYRALSPMPFDYIYGTTTYKKGSVVVRALRNRLGDSLFFECTKIYLNSFAYGNASSLEMEKSFEKTSGLNLTDFFKTWVFNPGLPHLTLSKYEAEQIGSEYKVTVFIDQKLWHAPEYYKNNNIIISAIDKNWNATNFLLQMDQVGKGVFKANEQPSLILVNTYNDQPDATTSDLTVVRNKSTLDLYAENIKITVDEITDSALLYVKYHWVGPDRTAGTPKNIRLSSGRYWTINGIWKEGYKSHAIIIYDGRITTTPESNGMLDNDLLTTTEDSLVLMYRPNQWSDWTIYNDFTKIMSSTTDHYGTIRINSIKQGEYTLAVYDYKAGIKLINENQGIKIYPNPAQNIVNIKFNSMEPSFKIELYDVQGKNRLNKVGSGYEALINTSNLPTGIYFLKINLKGIDYIEKIEIAN